VRRWSGQSSLKPWKQSSAKPPTPTLLDDLPLAGDILTGLDPAAKAALDLEVLWNKTVGQATVWVEITDATLEVLPGILNPAIDGYDDTTEPESGQATNVEDLFESSIRRLNIRQAPIFRDPLGYREGAGTTADRSAMACSAQRRLAR